MFTLLKSQFLGICLIALLITKESFPSYLFGRVAPTEAYVKHNKQSKHSGAHESGAHFYGQRDIFVEPGDFTKRVVEARQYLMDKGFW